MFTAVIDCYKIRNKTQEQLGISNALKLAEREGTGVKWGQGKRV